MWCRDARVFLGEEEKTGEGARLRRRRRRRRVVQEDRTRDRDE
jgi:hypothetical protein